MIFACMPTFGGDEREALLLARSLRAWGGRFSGSRLRVLEPQGFPVSAAACEALVELGAEMLPFRLPDAALHFPYAQKVVAAAAAEQSAGDETLVWMDSDSLVLQPPDEFDLPSGKSFGCCPVQLKNISSPVSAPVDGFWQAIFDGCELDAERVFPVITTMDRVEIRAQFNAGLLVTPARRGLLAAWQENFERLFQSPALLPFYALNPLYRIFAHQAVLSAVLLANVPCQEFHLFSPRYNAAIFLRERFPLQTADLVTCRYDELSFFDRPGWSSGDRAADAKISELLAAFRSGGE